jgi:hypothetical protein
MTFLLLLWLSRELIWIVLTTVGKKLVTVPLATMQKRRTSWGTVSYSLVKDIARAGR